MQVGCRVELSVPVGGTVETVSGNYTCSAGNTCVVDVNDLFFDETFVAKADEGYAFSHWIKRPRGLCSGSKSPCHLYTSLLEGNEILESLLASNRVFFLEPIFTQCTDGTVLSGHTSQQQSINLILCKNSIAHVDFVYQQLGEIPPDPDCRHSISADFSAPISAGGKFAVDLRIPAQTSDSGKLRLLAFDGRLSGSLSNDRITGEWDFSELEILCEKSTGETLRNFCGERFLPCIDQIDFSFDVD